jgi:putative ABC transport system permease protein
VSLLDSARVAWRALRANRLRSVLTTLGIIIGVGAVIAMISIGAGARARIAEQLRKLGPDLLYVSPGSVSSGGVRLGYGTRPTITLEDARALERELPAVQAAAPSVWTGEVQIVYGNTNWSTVVHGTTPSHDVVRRWPVVEGRFFGDEEVDTAAKVALLGQTVAVNLFGAIEPVGQIIRVGQVPFNVVGVLERKGQNFRGRDQDDTVLVPITTATKRVMGRDGPRGGTIHGITVRVRDSGDLAGVTQQIRELLRQRHELLPFQDDDFAIRNVAEVLQSEQESVRTLAILLCAIASVSLLVGGIGIMNIMLVSVTERTREIGIRMATGARERDILSQFLVEAVTLALIGGVIGVVLGVAASVGIGYFARWRTLISLEAVLLAFGSAAVTGVFFGFYPARKAAHLDPIEALRYE